MHDDIDVIQRPSTSYEVAKLAGVSHMTVARAFSGKGPVSEATKKKVMLAARKLNYKPNFFARGLNGCSTNTISIFWCLAHSYSPNRAFYDLIERGQKRGYQINLSETWADFDKMLVALDEASARGVDGVVLQMPILYSLERLQERLSNFKSVLLVTEKKEFDEFDELVWDRSFAVKDIVDYFVKTGRERPAFVTNYSSNSTKVKAFLDQLAKNDLVADVNSIVDMPLSAIQGGNSSAVEFFNDYFAKNKTEFDSFLCTSDEVAASLMRFFQDHGIKVPDDIAIVGFNDNPFAEIVRPTLASVDRRTCELANSIERMVFARLEDPKMPPQHGMVKMRFACRESAG